MAIAPIRENLIANGSDGFFSVVVEVDPFTLISGVGIHMEGFGREANNGKGVESSSICTHCDEVVCC